MRFQALCIFLWNVSIPSSTQHRTQAVALLYRLICQTQLQLQTKLHIYKTDNNLINKCVCGLYTWSSNFIYCFLVIFKQIEKYLHQQISSESLRLCDEIFVDQIRGIYRTFKSSFIIFLNFLTFLDHFKIFSYIIIHFEL